MTPWWAVTVRNTDGILGWIHGLRFLGSNSMESQSQENIFRPLCGEASSCYLRLKEGHCYALNGAPHTTPQKEEVKVLTCSDVTLFGTRVFADDQVKVELLGWALIQYDWCPYQKRNFGQRDRHTHSKNPCEDEGRDRGEVCASQGTIKCYQKTTGSQKRGMGSPSVFSEGMNPAEALTLDL